MSTLSEMAIGAIDREWATGNRWAGIERTYDAADVVRLRGSVRVEHSLARRGAERLWHLMHREDYVSALAALTGKQAVELVNAGTEAVYLPGWQVAAEANLSGQVYPDQGLYAATSVPAAVGRINNALRRADQIEWAETSTTGDGETSRDWMVPVIADAEAGFGGALNAYELMKSMIEAGAAGVHFEDQLSSEKRSGHTGGKVLIPTSQHIRTLTAARLAADVAGVPTVIVARTDSLTANLLTTDSDPRDQEFLTGERSPEGFFHVRAGIAAAVARGLAYAPYADLIWCDTSRPDLEEARIFAERIHSQYPGKLLAYNCSPSSGWSSHPDADTITRFQSELAAMGYAFQFGLESRGYSAHRHQRAAGAGYFDDITATLSGGVASTLAI